VGVSPAAAYRHFEDKDALLVALALDGFAKLALGMERAISRARGEPGSKAHAVASMNAVGLSYVEFAVQHPAHFRVMFGPWCGKEGKPPGAPGERGPYEILVATLDGLVASGAIPAQARPGAEIAAWASVHGLASLLVEGALRLTKPERAQAMRILGRTMLVGLGCEPALAGPVPAPLDTDPCAVTGERRPLTSAPRLKAR
jgi:AcrR family transcriptional regulator